MLWRRRWVALVVLVAPLTVVTIALLASGRTYEATTTIHLDPPWVPATHPDGPLDPTPDEAMAYLAAYAEGDYRALLDEAVAAPFDFRAETDTATSSLRFVVHAGSATDAWGAALAAAAGFADLSNDPARVDESLAAVDSEVTRIQAELGAPEVQAEPALVAAYEEELTALAERRATYEQDRATIEAGVAEVTEPAVRPTEPSAPDFARAVGLALLVGLLLVLPAVWLADRHGPPTTTGSRPPWHGSRRRAALSLVVLVAGPVALGALALSGLHSLWELRRVTDQQAADQIDCAERWVRSLPAGSTIYPQPEGRSQFWVAALSEAAFPRLRVAQLPEQADAQVQIVLEQDPRPGLDACSGYKAVILRP